MAIIDHGRMVACGPIDELRSGGPRRLRVDVQGAPEDWTDSLSGIEVVERSGSRAVLDLAPEVNLQRVLDVARGAGSVTHFAPSCSRRSPSWLTGKVLGIGLLGLAQLLLASVAALVAGRLAGGVGLPSAAPATIALVLLWFVLGYAFYSVAFAAVGALVSRQEDLTTAILPITLLMTGSFYLALIVANGNPNGTVARIAAFVPPFAPMVVPARMVLGDMSALGLALAVASTSWPRWG